MSQTLFTDTLTYLWITSAQLSCFIKQGVTEQWSSSGLELRPLLYLCICFVTTKMIVGVGKCVYSSVCVPVQRKLAGEEHVGKQVILPWAPDVLSSSEHVKLCPRIPLHNIQYGLKFLDLPWAHTILSVALSSCKPKQGHGFGLQVYSVCTILDVDKFQLYQAYV